MNKIDHILVRDIRTFDFQTRCRIKLRPLVLEWNFKLCLKKIFGGQIMKNARQISEFGRQINKKKAYSNSHSKTLNPY